jgi:hypothetical protein
MPVTVEHSGDWNPHQYRNYTDPDRKYKKPKRRYEGLPSLPRVSKPEGLTEVKPKSDPTPVDESISKANNNDLKSRNLITPDK